MSDLQQQSSAPAGPVDPETQEVAPGFVHENLQGAVWNPTSEEELREGLEKAFDYRGDITITRKDGTTVTGYLFDRRSADTLAASTLRMMPTGSSTKLTLSYAEVASLAFTGRDTAAGKSWEAWVKKYLEKKAAGERNIQLVPEALE